MPERRVVHVVRSDSFAGVERYVCDTVNELARRGWDVSVIGGQPELMRQALLPEVAHTPARTTAEVARAIWATGPVPLLHTHMTAAEAAAAPLKGIRFDRWVTTRHFARPRGSSRLGRTASPLIRARVDVQIAISQFVAGRIDGPSIVIHNGVPPSTQDPVRRDRTVVMMQRLEAEKATAVGIRAWAEARLGELGWRLRIFGRGSQLDELGELAAKLRIEEFTTFEGFSPDPRRALAQAGILVAPCPIDGFGLTVVEAMSEGTPVVAAAGGAHRETLGGVAALFSPSDAADAAAHVRRLAENDALRDRIGADLRTRYESAFTVTRHVDALEEVYVR